MNYKCFAIYANITWNSATNSYNIENEILDLKLNYNVSFFKKHKCYFNEFNYEFLLFCGGENNISCYRKDKNTFNTINKFTLDLIGSINNIYISIHENIVTILYSNETSGIYYSYKYTIDPITCRNNNIFLSVKSFQKNDIYLNDEYINIKTNTKYFIKFQNLPSEYGIIKFGELKINSTDEFFEIKPEMKIISFISNNYNIIDELKLFYNVTIQESYSSL